MAQASILAPGITAAVSKDVVVEAEKAATIGIYSYVRVDDAKFNSLNVLMVTPGGDNKIDTLSNTKRTVTVTGPGTYRVERCDSQGDAFGAFVAASWVVPDPFSPLVLFTDGEQGAWYDPSDMATMFADKYGTTPITAAGQSVGLILDKRLDMARGPELIADPSLGGNNAAAEWGLVGVTEVNTIVFTDGKVTVTTDGADVAIYKDGLEIGQSYEIIVQVDAVSGTEVGVLVDGADVAFAPGVGPRRMIFTADGTMVTINRVGGAGTFTLDSISVRKVAGNHASQEVAAACPILRNDGELWYLEFDGVDDFLTVEAFDLFASQLTVCSGTRNLSTAPEAIIAELDEGYASPGSFSLSCPSSATAPNRGVGVRSDSVFVGGNDQVAPFTAIASAMADRVAPSLELRVDGALVASSVSAQEAGRFDSHPLYIGSRAGTNNAFAGYLYGLIIRGALTDAKRLTNTESYLAAKSGVTL